MNNEIGRKITSLTLMTIMLAGGMVIAAPSMMPAAHAANANLFVSAENSQFDNYMSGPQVIEVVVIDSDISDTDEGKGEPDVTVNGKDLRMVQAVDGNWYAYFADRTMASTADATSTGTAGVGLDYGAFCSAATAGAIITDQSAITAGTLIGFGDTSGVIVNEAVGGAGALDSTCAKAAGTNAFSTASINNVVREAKQPNANSVANPGTASTSAGQIGIEANSWPFIQLYPLNPTGNVVVQYNKGGGVQTTTLTFDTVDHLAGTSLDRTVFPQSAEIHATITDLWLNIDPTDEDSWTWNTVTGDAYYQIFDENGGQPAAGEQATNFDLTSAQKSSLMCEDNCTLLINTDQQGTGTNVLNVKDNADVQYDVVTASDPTTVSTTVVGFTTTLVAGTVPVTVTELGPNSGVFGTYDEDDNSVLFINSAANRGTSATIDYNETAKTILVGHEFATVDIQPLDDEWNSGEEIPVVITDGDANRNSRGDEDLDLNNVSIDLIPSLSTGDPFTLGEGTTTPQVAYLTATGGAGNVAAGAGAITAATAAVDKFSERAIVTPTPPVGTNGILIDYATTAADLQNTVSAVAGAGVVAGFHGFNLINLDVRGLTTGTVNVYLVDQPGDILTTAGGHTIPTAIGAGQPATTTLTTLATGVSNQGINNLGAAVSTALAGITGTNNVGLLIEFTTATAVADTAASSAFVADFFSYGFSNSGEVASERIANQIIRIEAEESGDNTGVFEGSLEYVMVNQLNILDVTTYTGLTTVANDPGFIVIEDLTDEDSPRVNYNDLGADGVTTQVADQEEAPSHSGVVSFDNDNYKVADTVTITLEDLDLNVDSDLIEIYTVVTDVNDPSFDAVGVNAVVTVPLSFGNLGRLLDITFDDVQWKSPQNQGTDLVGAAGSDCESDLTGAFNLGLSNTGFTLVETGSETGTFIGDFQIPDRWCRDQTVNTTADDSETTTGLDLEVNYVDFRDASGEIIEVGDSAGVRANTGSISLDRTVYPVPFGVPSDFGSPTVTSPDNRSIFAIHSTGITGANTISTGGSFIATGDLTVHIRVNDPDFDTSATGEDIIATNTAANPVGPVKLSVIRGSDTVVLGYAGGANVVEGVIDVGNNAVRDTATGTVFFNDLNADGARNPDGVDGTAGTADDEQLIRQFGPIDEIAPDAGIFEIDIPLRYTDGPADAKCSQSGKATTDYTPINGAADGATNAVTDRFDIPGASGNSYCILQGDILQVQYTDPADASGDVNTVTDSATFDLRNGVLQSDKSVYLIGGDMILTLIEPDFDLDNDQAETYSLNLIEWDSDAATTTMGSRALTAADIAAFDPEPSDFRETGDSTGIFQIVIEVPEVLSGDRLERGEEIVLEYTDWGPSGSDFVGDEDEDVNVTVFTSNFGATVELDQKVYSWADKVYITVVAPDHNFDSDLVDEIGNSDLDPLKVSTRGFDLDNYKLVETGTDTGIFTGEVILTGFTHDADGDGTNDITVSSATGAGPTDGKLPTDDDDGLTVSFEFSEDETVVGSALIRWNIGETQWLEASYPASGTGVVRIIDPDMNLDPEAVDNFDVDVWSDSDAGGIDLTVTETNEATGIFEGTVFFTVADESSGHRLRVAEGDTVTAEYEDNTLPDPYTTADELDITATSLIGTVVPPLERAPAASLKTVDAFGNSLDSVSVDQQVQISADLANGQDREQTFAYLVQIQDGNGVTVSLAWITGSLSAGQSFSPALSWIPTEAGTYTATAFVWESVDNPTALSPPVSTTITVQ